jgi:hypothetical protein
MHLWTLQKPPSGLVEPYESARLREEARELGLQLETVAPQQIDLVVSRCGRRSIRRCGTDYFSLAILRQLEHLVCCPRDLRAKSLELFQD